MSLLSPRQLHTLQRLTSETVDGAHGHSSGVLQPSPTAFSLAAAVIGSAAPQPSPPDSFPVRGLGETLRSALRTGMVRSVSLPLQAGDDADMGHELHWRPVPILPPMAAAAAGAGAGVVAAVGVGGVRPDEAPAGKPPSAAAPPLTTWTTVAPVPVPAPATGAHGAAVASTATSVPPLSIGMSVVVAGAAQHDVGASVEAGASEHRRSPAMPRHLPPLQVPQSSPLLPSRSSDSGAGGGLQWTGPLTDAARAIIAHAGMDPAAFQAQVAVGADATSASGGGGLDGAGSLLSPLRTASFPNPSPGTPGVATFALPAPPSAEGDSDEDADIAYSFYPGTGESDVPFANIINAPIPPLWRERREARSKGVNKDASRATLGRLAFRRAITERLMPALRAFSPDVILVSAGFDGEGRRGEDGGRGGGGWWAAARAPPPPHTLSPSPRVVCRSGRARHRQPARHHAGPAAGVQSDAAGLCRHHRLRAGGGEAVLPRPRGVGAGGRVRLLAVGGRPGGTRG
jgi:hypothetical protein